MNVYIFSACLTTDCYLILLRVGPHIYTLQWFSRSAVQLCVHAPYRAFVAVIISDFVVIKLYNESPSATADSLCLCYGETDKEMMTDRSRSAQ